MLCKQSFHFFNKAFWGYFCCAQINVYLLNEEIFRSLKVCFCFFFIRFVEANNQLEPVSLRSWDGSKCYSPEKA